MSKCPKCGCEFHESKFATIIVDKDMPPGTWRMGNCTDADRQPQTDILGNAWRGIMEEAGRAMARKMDADIEAEERKIIRDATKGC